MGTIKWHTGIEMRSNAESYEAVGQEAGFVMESVEKVSFLPWKNFVGIKGGLRFQWGFHGVLADGSRRAKVPFVNLRELANNPKDRR